jgi:hypothetical protein
MCDLDEIRRALQVLFSPGEVRELRLPETCQGVISGCFDDPETLTKAAMACSGSITRLFLRKQSRLNLIGLFVEDELHQREREQPPTWIVKESESVRG